MDTNLLATILVCKHAKVRPNGMPFVLARHFLSSYLTVRQGCIINVSSLMAIKGGRGATAYAASKAGLVGESHSVFCVHSYANHLLNDTGSSLHEPAPN